MTTKHSEVGASQIALQAATPQTAGITVAWAGLQPKTPSHITREAVQVQPLSRTHLFLARFSER